MNKTNIQWTDFTSNPIRYRNAEGLDVWACVKVSDGCTNCYAESLALSPRMVSKGRALGAKFNAHEMAKLTPYVDEGELWDILNKPSAAGKRCFVGDMTDIFGEWVTDAMLDEVFAAMALRPDVTFQVLTKRPERMRAYVSESETRERVCLEAFEMCAQSLVLNPNSKLGDGLIISLDGGLRDWPLPNVWLGTSVENQEQADARIPELLATPAAVRFLSCEPLLGPVEFSAACIAPFDGFYDEVNGGIHWVIFGGESGPKARPCDIGWIRDGVRQCQAAGVPVFVKQLGAKPVCRPGEMPIGTGRGEYMENGYMPRLKHNHGGNPEEWPEDLRVREWPQ